MNRIFVFGMIATLVLLNGCTADKKVYDLIGKLEARIEALEKIVIPPKEEPKIQASAYDIPVDNSYVLGNKDAKVHVVVFSNFQCPYCARADKLLRGLLNDPELKEKINIVFKHFPFDRHPEAKPASKAALAAGEQGKFWEMAEKIFENQNELNEKSYQKWAKELGLNMAKYAQDLKDNDQKYNEMIDKDIKLGTGTAKLEGTPWILVSGWLFEGGEINPDNFKKLIKEKNL